MLLFSVLQDLDNLGVRGNVFCWMKRQHLEGMGRVLPSISVGERWHTE